MGERQTPRMPQVGHQGIEEFMKKFPFTPYVLENYRTSTAQNVNCWVGSFQNSEDDSVLITIQMRRIPICRTM